MLTVHQLNEIERYRAEFLDFLDEQTLDFNSITELEVILWLESLAANPEDGTPARAAASSILARITAVSRDPSLGLDKALLSRFLSNARKAGEFRDSRPPSPAIPLEVLRRIARTFSDTGRELYIKAVLLTIFYTGLSPSRVFALRLHDYEEVPSGLVFPVLYRNAPFKIPVAQARDSSFCLVRTLKRWLDYSGILDSGTNLLFPATHWQRFKLGVPTRNPHVRFETFLNRALKVIGEKRHYDYYSFRRSLALSLLQSGYTEIEVAMRMGYSNEHRLRHFLRAEPRWWTLPPSLLELSTTE
jgi:integrase